MYYIAIINTIVLQIYEFSNMQRFFFGGVAIFSVMMQGERIDDSII